MIKEANVTVIVSDLTRSVRFYTAILGLKLKNLVKNEWAEVEASGLTIGLHPAEEHGPQPGKSESLSIGFVVDNLEQSMVELKSKGVVFAPEIVNDGPVKLSFFSDPDKNPLYLCEIQMSGKKENNMKNDLSKGVKLEH